jgi:hypothetical protein
VCRCSSLCSLREAFSRAEREEGWIANSAQNRPVKSLSRPTTNGLFR